METSHSDPELYEALASTLAGAVERQLSAFAGRINASTDDKIAIAQRADHDAIEAVRSEFQIALQQQADSLATELTATMTTSLNAAMQAVVPEVQRLLNELNTQVVQRIDTTEHRATDRMLQLEERVNEQQGTKIANLEATLGRIGSGFDDAIQALSQRMLELENRLLDTNDSLDTLRQKTEQFDAGVFDEVREQLSSAIGESMLVRIELDRLTATTDEKIDRATLRMAEIEALLTDEMDVSAAVQLERLEDLERAIAELDPHQFVRHTDPLADVRPHEVAADTAFSPAAVSAAPMAEPIAPPAPIEPVKIDVSAPPVLPAFSVPPLSLPTLPTLSATPSHATAGAAPHTAVTPPSASF